MPVRKTSTAKRQGVRYLCLTCRRYHYGGGKLFGKHVEARHQNGYVLGL